MPQAPALSSFQPLIEDTLIEIGLDFKLLESIARSAGILQQRREAKALKPV